MVICVVIGCSNRSDRRKHGIDDKRVTFHRIPTVTSHFGKRELELTERRRAGYLAAISREDQNVEKLDNYRICSKHFVSGWSASNWDETNVDWLPTMHLGHNKQKHHHQNICQERSERAKRRKDNHQQQEESNCLMMQQIDVVSMEITSETVRQQAEEVVKEVLDSFLENIALQDAAIEAIADRMISEVICIEDIVNEEMDSARVSFAEGKCKCADKIASLNKELNICHSLIESLSARLEHHLPSFCEASLKDESSVTGLPNMSILKSIFNHVCGTLPTEGTSKCKLTNFQEFMLVLLKLRLNSPVLDLVYRFIISAATVSRILLKWLTQMDIRLKSLIIWPDRECLQKTMPSCFQVAFGKKVAIILDCFEIFIEQPSNLQARATTWSNYKHRNTAKVLLGIVPQGVIAFVSDTWGGRVSDKYLTEHSGMLSKLLPGDVVLADRGFDIAESVGMMQATLHLPAFTKGKSQLSALEVEETRTIANVRIHVERVIGMVKQKYPILQSTIPIDFV